MNYSNLSDSWQEAHDTQAESLARGFQPVYLTINVKYVGLQKYQPLQRPLATPLRLG